jgi:hypothetical protein
MTAVKSMSHHLNFLALLALIASLAAPVQAQPAPPAKNGNGALPPASAAADNTAPAITPNAEGSAVTNGQPPAAPEAETPKVVTPPSPTLSDLGRSLRTYFTEEELSLLFQYMKESVMASFKDEEVNLPPDLSFKLEILLVRLKKESGHYMDNLIDQLEKDLKHKLKEKLTPPPIKDTPYNPWYSKP